MSEKLDQIRALIDEAAQELEQLAPSSLTKTEIDKVTKKRASLRDRLELLREQEALELTRIEEAAELDRADRRVELLNQLLEKARDRNSRYTQLNRQIETGMGALMRLIQERDEVLKPHILEGLQAEAKELLVDEELDEIATEERERTWSLRSEYSFIADLARGWRYALNEQGEMDKTLYFNLSRFASQRKDAGEIPSVGDNLITLIETCLNPPAQPENEEEHQDVVTLEVPDNEGEGSEELTPESSPVDMPEEFGVPLVRPAPRSRRART